MIKVPVGDADGGQRELVFREVGKHGGRFAAHIHGHGLPGVVDKIAVGLQGAQREGGYRHVMSSAG
jgi:hypothetical protein